ncbi:MAG: response regulator [Desulfobacterales bacterium]|nr:response regulator [Desulfobacterales bacterium]
MAETEQKTLQGGRTILVVDDEAEIRRGCERILKSEGYRVFLASGGQAGLNLLRRQPGIDLVLVDLKMPGMGGFEFLDRARRIATEIEFVVITAYATIESAVEATKRGAYDFIAKPFTPDTLLHLAKRALERVSLLQEKNRLEAERRQRMLELGTEKSRLRMIIDCMEDGVLVCNAEKMLVLHNPAALKLIRHTPLKAGNYGVSEVITIKALVEMISQVSECRKRISREIILEPASRNQCVLSNTAPVIDPDSRQFLGTITVVRDISEIRRVEDVKARFVSMVAHELRAPLAAVDGYLENMEAGHIKTFDKQQEIIKRSRRRLGALMEMVNDLLGMARIEAGTAAREISSQNIAQIVDAVVFMATPLAEEKNVQINVSLDKNLPAVQADHDDLQRLFSNLVSNAVKYNRKDGSVILRAQADGPYIRISVSDTGIGFLPENREDLFTEFFREKRKETRLVTGTGLGLSIVKQIVDFYHGRIHLESKYGKGSKFTVWLPASA